IEESTTAPVATLEANTGVAAAVIDTAVEANMRTPVTAVPDVEAFVPPPVSRRPDIPRTGELRLHVHRQRRRRHRDRNADRDAGMRDSRNYGERTERERRY